MQNISLNGVLKSKGKFGICRNCRFFNVVTWNAKLEFNSIFCSLTGSRICYISLFSWWRGNETSSIHTFWLWKTKYQWITYTGETGKGGEVVRALASLLPMWPGSNPGVDAIRGVKFVVGSLPCSERFFLRVLRFSPPFKNQYFHLSVFCIDCFTYINITAKFVVSRCEYCKLRKDFRFFCSVNYFSEGGVNENHNETCSPSFAEKDSRPPRIAKGIAMVSGVFVEWRRQTFLYSCKWQE